MVASASTCAVLLVTSGAPPSQAAAPAQQPAQQSVTRIWDGVFTQAQATRGNTAFHTHCASCHGDDLTGGDGPALIGGNFRQNWGSRYLDRLYKKMREKMPPGEENLVSDADKLDILAFLLQSNRFPAGAEALKPEPEYLAGIQIVGKNGPEPAPTGATVEVIGCLVQDGNTWKLTNSTEPMVSTLDDPVGDAAAAAKRALGTQTVRLLDVYPKPDAHKGHTMMAKGLLIRSDADLQVNVLALDMVSPTCAP